MWLAASGVFCVIVYVIGFGIIGMGIPPWIAKASMSPQQFFDIYRDHSSRIMWGMTIATFAGGLSMAFSCQVSAQMWQREKKWPCAGIGAAHWRCPDGLDAYGGTHDVARPG